MPDIGEIKRAEELGQKGRNKYIWLACIDCGRERFVRIIHQKPKSPRCKTCQGKLIGSKSRAWKGGRFQMKEGYIRIKLQPDDFFYSMARKDGYVLEHRLVVAKALCHCLLP